MVTPVIKMIDVEFTRLKNLIDGKWVEEKGVEYIPLYNPSTGEEIGEVPLTTRETSQMAIDSSARAYKEWRRVPLAKRMSYIFKIREAMEIHFEELAQTIAFDQAKHISEARGEVRRVIEIVEMACTIPALIQGGTVQCIADNINGRIIRAPLGVFAGVAPFNFPALVFGWFIPFAVATGNTFIFKPSPESPLFMQKMGEILMEIGLPNGVVNVVNGDHVVAECWYESPEIAGVCMVGSSPTAKKIAEACGRTGKKIMLLGGAKNYLVAMEDANIDALIENIKASGYGSAGQRCLASANIAVAAEIYDDVVERLVESSKDIVLGDARDPNVTVGPVISAQAKKRIETDIDNAINNGAVLALDGRNPSVAEANANGYFVGPTILKDVNTSMEIAQKEVFGPVVQMIKFETLDEILDEMKKMPVGNGACIFTQSLYYADRFIDEADVGMVGVNIGISASHPYMPFGGIKDSLIGNNKAQGKAGIDFFTQEKVATVRSIPPSRSDKIDTGSYQEKKEDASIKSCTAS